MNAFGKNRYEPKSKRFGSIGWQPWRMMGVRCLCLLVMALVWSLVSLLTADQVGATRPTPMRATAFPIQLDRPLMLATPLQPEKSRPPRTMNAGFLSDFLRDGLEFVLAGLETSGKLEPIKQIVATIGQLAQLIAGAGEPWRIADGNWTHSESQVLTHSKSSSMSLATWMLQNSGANR